MVSRPNTGLPHIDVRCGLSETPTFTVLALSASSARLPEVKLITVTDVDRAFAAVGSIIYRLQVFWTIFIILYCQFSLFVATLKPIQ
jgi:hypothetical protein